MSATENYVSQIYDLIAMTKHKWESVMQIDIQLQSCKNG